MADTVAVAPNDRLRISTSLLKVVMAAIQHGEDHVIIQSLHRVRTDVDAFGQRVTIDGDDGELQMVLSRELV